MTRPKIYGLFSVTYNYYRWDNLLYISEDIDALTAYAKKRVKKSYFPEEFRIVYSFNESDGLDANLMHHYLIVPIKWLPMNRI